MRVLLAVTLLALLPGWAAAGQRAHGEKPDPPASLPAIGLPLPDIGLPLPTIGLPPQQPRGRAVTPGRRPAPPPRGPHRGNGRGHPRAGIVYVVPTYGVVEPPAADAPAEDAAPSAVAPATPEPPPGGTLWLDLEPATVNGQVFVDGYYVGTTADVGRELALEAGAHAVEVRAPGYEPMTVNVKIDAGRALTYRAALQAAGTPAPAPTARAGQAAKAAQPPPRRKPFYAIPGCYLGDVPPKEAALPKNCDPAKAVTIWP